MSKENKNLISPTKPLLETVFFVKVKNINTKKKESKNAL